MNIKLATDQDRQVWDDYVEKSSAVSPLNFYVWRNILSKSYQAETFFFIAQDQNHKIVGVCPSYVIKGMDGRRRMYGLRFGFIADNSEASNLLLFYIKDFCAQRGIIPQALTSGYSRVSPPENFREVVKKTLVLRLGADEKIMWEGLRNKTRNMIRRAERSKLTIARGFQHLDDFYRIYASRMMDKGVHAQAYCFFSNIAEYLKDSTELLVAKQNNKVIAGMLLMFGKQNALYPYQACASGAEQYAPNQLLIWEAMRLCSKRGIEQLDMGESTEGGSVYQSKINFGGDARDIYYLKPKNEKHGFHGATLFFMFPLAIYARIIQRCAIIALKVCPFNWRVKFSAWLKKRDRII